MFIAVGFFEYYRSEFKNRGIEPARLPDHRSAEPQPLEVLPHCAWMVGEMDAFLNAGRREKFMRWLGFIQGVWWAGGYATVQELMAQNRPPEGAA